MRVIAGTHGGRTLRAPRGRGTRPTSDRVREALFSILGSAVLGANVLDLYAGSGALGIEALSRGASSAVFVERDGATVRVLRANLESLGVEASVIAAEVVPYAHRHVGGAVFDIVFADPPYSASLADLVNALHALADAGALASEAQIVLERDRRSIDELPAWLDPQQRRSYGDTVLLFLRVNRTAGWNRTGTTQEMLEP